MHTRSPASTTSLLARRLSEAAVTTAGERIPSRTAAALLEVLVDEFRTHGGALLLTDPATMQFFGGAVRNLPAKACRPFLDTELGSTWPRSFARMALTGAPASALAREPHRERDPYYVNVLEPFGFADELRVVCVVDGSCWGALSLVRGSGEGGFTARHERSLDELASRLGAWLRASILSSIASPSGKVRRHGVVVLDGQQVVDISEGAASLVGEIDRGTLRRPEFLPYLVNRAVTDPDMSVLLTSDEGQWLSAAGHSLEGNGRTAILLTDATPAHLVTTLVASARLTPREVEVALWVCRGASDQEIARELGISMHTAQDHVKSIRAKLGVPRRSAIAARLFSDYYLDDFMSAVSVTGT
jgi:DNA-binding CsgD family transcriptional regulator